MPDLLTKIILFIILLKFISRKNNKNTKTVKWSRRRKGIENSVLANISKKYEVVATIAALPIEIINCFFVLFL